QLDCAWFVAVPGNLPVDLDTADLAVASKVYDHEERVGIVRSEATLTAEDRMFYTSRLFRLARGVGFAVDVEMPSEEANRLIEQLDGMVVPLGGKGHRARIRLLPGPLIADDLAADDTGAYKLWLLTPLPLREGFTGWPEGVTCAATERTVPIGGFDLAER